MRKRILVGVVASLAVLPASALAAGLPKFHSTLIVPGHSVAGVSVGERAAKAIRGFGGNSACVPGPTLRTCTWGSSANGARGSVTLYFAGGKVTLIALQLSADHNGVAIFRGPLMKLKTSKGIGMRSDALQLEQAYPGKVASGAVGWTLGTGAHATTFSTSGGRFVSITVGNNGNI